MTLAHSAGLQTALYQRLSGDAALTVLLSGAVYDTAPAGELQPIYLLLGEEKVIDLSASGGEASRHEMKLSVVASGGGFAAAKLVCAAVHAALQGALHVGAQSCRGLFVKAEAKVLSGGAARRIELFYNFTLG